MRNETKYSDQVTNLLVDLGYTHCFFVPGGNIMHLLDSARTKMKCIPFVHEVSAAIAVEYFNEISVPGGGGRAYVLVTAGPGLTNAITGIAGAYLESRECLVIGGQVKSTDLAHGLLRQRGIQEVDGISIAAPVCKAVMRIEQPISGDQVRRLVQYGSADRKGPIFLEFCLDAQGSPPMENFYSENAEALTELKLIHTARQAAELIANEIELAQRPVLLIGGGIKYELASNLRDAFETFGVPVMTTWNGADRIAEDHPLFMGRPNNWGQRSANVLIRQADVVVAMGTRLGMQQTGFNWQNWTQGRIVQVDVDREELVKGHPRIDLAINADANETLEILLASVRATVPDWIEFCRLVRDKLPIQDPENSNAEGYLSPFELMRELAELLDESDVIVPASSGSGQFVPMEVHTLRAGQRMLTNKGLASMGYGLAAACGAALGSSGRRVLLIEGDGSFSQNIQELGTAVAQRLNVKIFILDNDGYASIRTTQRNYFGGEYLGCDSSTGLGFPNWLMLAKAFDIPAVVVESNLQTNVEAMTLLRSPGPSIFVIRVDPDQTYFPKVTSAISASGSMISNPTHLMTPALSDELAAEVFGHLQMESDSSE